ncbi:putative bifunctional diguanylate cyclase/phosphodiesterase [Pseudoalteromonas aurantia]|uniref:GGDEF domain-containing response regulator n=1 Tax=Pseudoalteromonas aurantia TaxID=43654 RepID=A0A5S3V810_9GAMM|nr:GGDEF domain-containing response regulator [Pseudoalteromonas aurantia]TMO56870.1 GGDEF domain-containing response regulator [Pseudoalteromonas aurantia]TMO67922.1 GGDEF domain-containing response regulator [Pseudoalteromonas aurantia]TMO73795.1 GGDEF domain-containing response regulator [Pseudoalteromonas aurantia]
MNILLIDDDIVDSKSIQRSLNSTNNSESLTVVNNAEQALYLIEHDSFDVILLDYMMPKMNGIEMLLELKRRSWINKMAVVMISNEHSESIILKSIDAGAQDFLLKSEINAGQLKRALMQAQKRFELENKLVDSYQKVKELAENDHLTGLYNRYYFGEALQRAIIANRTYNANLAVLQLDLDNFKNINDSFGHDIGNALLQEIALRFKSVLQQNDLVARIGGDEFAFIITSFNSPLYIERHAQRILTLVNQPVIIEKRCMHVTGSIGIALHPLNGQTVEDLMRYADIAMYRAKQLGKNKACLFEDNMEKDFQRKYRIEVDLRHACEHQELEMYYQPIVDTQSRRVVSCEALIRWPTAKLNTNPQEFMNIAEESRLIDSLGRWIIDTAIYQQTVISNKLGYTIKMAINLSPLQLRDPTLPTFIQKALKKYQAKGKNIVFELTETALLGSDDVVRNSVNAIKKLNCLIALDDFGTGYSSISHLLTFPIDIVKLDKSLLDKVHVLPRYYHILKGLSSMLHQLRIAVVAEGVESAQQVAICSELDIERIQGYYFAKPTSHCRLFMLIQELTDLTTDLS